MAPAKSAAQWLAEADALHAAARHAEAAAAYQAALEQAPGDWQAWLRYAEAVRAGGDAGAALLLLREAERLAPEEPAVALAMAEALRRLDRPAEAEETLARLPATQGALAAAGAFFDVSDLLEFFARNRTPTGIQRVQLNLLRELLAAGHGTACAYERASAAFKPVPETLFLRLESLARIGAEPAEWQATLALLAEAMHQAAPCAFGPLTSLVNLGTSWWQPDYMRRVAQLKRRVGLRYIAFVYDCIPLLRPEFCAEALVEEFARWFAQACLTADGVVVISENTRRDFEALRRQVLPRVAIPVFTLPLDADASLASAEAAPPAERGRPYVLFVATLEARKNHALAFRAWAELLRRHGPAAVPELVCVGKLGWKAEPALELLEATPGLRDHVTLLHGVSDRDLASLYRGCAFTLFASHYEGWGLPVTESFSYGRAAVVAENSSLPEAGGRAALYFPADDLDALLARLEAMLFQPGQRAAQEALLRETVRLRPWSALAEQLAGHIRAAAGVLLPSPRLTMRPGEVWEGRLLPGATPHLPSAALDLAREGEAWMPLESWGCWVRPGRVALRLPLAEMPGRGPLRVLVQFVGPPQPWRIGVRAGPGTGITRDFTWLTGTPQQVVHCAFEVPFEAWPEVLVEIDAPTPVALAAITPSDDRIIGFGFLHAMVSRTDDFAARLDYLEGRSLAPLARV